MWKEYMLDAFENARNSGQMRMWSCEPKEGCGTAAGGNLC